MINLRVMAGIFSLVSAGLFSSCENATVTLNNNGNPEQERSAVTSQVKVSDSEEIKKYLDENINIKKDDADNIMSLQGLKFLVPVAGFLGAKEVAAENSQKLESKEELAKKHADLKSVIEGDKKLFVYDNPTDYDVGFSRPMLATQELGFHLASDSGNICQGVSSYFPEEPAFSLVMEAAKKECGSLKMDVCLRLSKKGSKSGDAKKDYVFLKLPIQIDLPCSDEIFKDTSISLSSKESKSYKSTKDLELSAGPLVAQMYITNKADCTAGGHWESFNTKKQAWLLAWNSSKTDAAFYAKFKDLMFGVESSCVKGSILVETASTSEGGGSINPDVSADSEPDDLADDLADEQTSEEGGGSTAANPTLTTLSVVSLSGSSVYTTSTTVNLALSASSGASQLYLTNTAGCGAGGSWQSYAASYANWELSDSNTTARVYGKVRDSLGNESECVSGEIIHDTLAPTSVSLSIASGAAYTSEGSVTLTLGATGASEMYLTNTAGCGSGGVWQAYASSKSAWNLSQSNATATVYVQYRDAAGNASACVSDSILHDDTAPTATSLSIAAGASYTSSTSVALTLSATGASEMYVSNTAGCGSGGVWEDYASSKAGWSLEQTNATASVYVKYKDAAGNTSSCISDSIIHDDTPPSTTTLSIAEGAAYTTSSTVSLSLAATDASQMYLTNTAGCGSGGSWESYATSKASWTLGQSNASATVYGKFKDAAGNESSCVNDSIIHDDTVPSFTTFTISSGASYTTSSNVSLSFVASADASEMYLTNTAGCASGGSWEPYATGKSPWTLGQTNGTATVYGKVKDSAGNTSTCSSDSIVHDSVVPTTPVSLSASSASTTQVVLSWSASTDSGSGIAAYEVALGSTAGGTEVKDWTNVGNVTSATVTGLSLSSSSSYYPSVRVIDAAANVSSVMAGSSFTLLTALPTQLASGSGFNCALFDNGTVKCWGANGYGRLGQNHTNIVGDGAGEMASLQPIPFKDGRTMQALATGEGEHMCAISTAGEVFCWGRNNNGQLGQGTTTDIGGAADDMQNLNPVDLGTGRTATQVAVSKISCALLDNGKVKCWGVNNGGQLGMGDQTSRTSPPVAAVNLGTGRTATKVRTGGEFTCALLDNASLKCWGMNANAQLGLGSTLGRQLAPGAAIDFGSSLTVTDFDLSVTHGCAVLSNGSVKCWGTDSYGNLGQDIPSDSTNRKIGDALDEIASLSAVNLGAGNTASEIKLGNYSSCVLLAGADAGKLKCWGYNLYGKLGQGSTSDYGKGVTGYMMANLNPIDLGTGRTAVKFSPGTNATCALLDNDLVKCWGYGDNGQLGYNTGKSATRGDGANEMGDNLIKADL